jgi:uncharacterized protein (DUF58 family)
MRTQKCAGIIAGCIALIVFSLFFVEWLVLIFIIPLLIFLFAGVVSFYGKDIHVSIERIVSNVKVFENDEVEIILNIRNLGENIPYIELYDRVPKKTKIVEGTNFHVLDLKKNDEVQIRYKIFCPLRGRFVMGPVYLRVNGFLGMFFKEKEIETPTSITVIPKTEKVTNVSLKSKPTIFPGVMQVKHAGIGTEFYGIRKYTTGDTFKRINWKTFARYRDLMVNQYELERTKDVIIIVDSRGAEGIGSLKHSPLEYSIRAAVALAQQYLKRRDRVGLIAYGPSDGYLKWIYPESGKKQLYKIIEELVSLQPFGDFPFSGAVYRSVTHLIPKKSLVILISSLENDWSISKGVEQLVAYDFNLLIISPSPFAIEYSMETPDKNTQLAYRILKFERENYIGEIRELGAKVIDWNPTLPLSVSLQEVEKLRIRR